MWCKKMFIAYVFMLGIHAYAQKNHVQNIEIENNEDQTVIHIKTASSPVYLVYALKDPRRLVLDVSDADMSKIVQGMDKVDDVIDHIEVQKQDQNTSSLVRISVFLTKDVEHHVNKTSEGIAWIVQKRPIKNKEYISVTSLKKQKNGTVLIPVSSKVFFEVQNLENPKRTAIDVLNASLSDQGVVKNIRHQDVSKFRVAQHEGYVRFVLDLKPGSDYPNVFQTQQGIVVSFESKKTAKKEEELPWSDVATVSDVQYQIVNQRNSQLVLSVSGDKDAISNVNVQLVRKTDHKWSLECSGVRIPKFLQRILDASSLGTVVKSITSVEENAESSLVRIEIELFGKAQGTVSKKRGQWILSIKDKRDNRESFAENEEHSRHVSVDLRDADLIGVIRLISDISGQNIIASDAVRGKVTMRLMNVPWDKALDTILRAKGFDRVKDGNIWRISTIDEITKEREADARKKTAEQSVADTVLQMIPINYALSSEVMEQIKPLLSPRGTVQQDTRTNTLIVQDLPERVKDVISLAKKLDKQTPQVLIEARIVEAQSNHLQDLGVQWGGMGQATARTGNPTGLSFPGDVVAQGAADDASRNQSGGNTTPSRYAVNLPATVGSGMGGGIGFIFGSANGSQLLNLRLTAMEANGDGRIISSPRVTTLDNKTAKIAQGIDIPISVVSAAGANTRFISANLELEVTPHVTNEGSVLLKIKTSKNEPDFTQRGAAGDPTIVKKFAETEVLVADGETTVIGGIFTRTTSEVYAEVPYLSKIPVIGWLFKSRRKEDKRAELLVFISPRIVNRQEALPQQAFESVDRKQPMVYETVSP